MDPHAAVALQRAGIDTPSALPRRLARRGRNRLSAGRRRPRVFAWSLFRRKLVEPRRGASSTAAGIDDDGLMPTPMAMQMPMPSFAIPYPPSHAHAVYRGATGSGARPRRSRRAPRRGWREDNGRRGSPVAAAKAFGGGGFETADGAEPSARAQQPSSAGDIHCSRCKVGGHWIHDCPTLKKAVLHGEGPTLKLVTTISKTGLYHRTPARHPHLTRTRPLCPREARQGWFGRRPTSTNISTPRVLVAAAYIRKCEDTYDQHKPAARFAALDRDESPPGTPAVVRECGSQFRAKDEAAPKRQSASGKPRVERPRSQGQNPRQPAQRAWAPGVSLLPRVCHDDAAGRHNPYYNGRGWRASSFARRLHQQEDVGRLLREALKLLPVAAPRGRRRGQRRRRRRFRSMDGVRVLGAKRVGVRTSRQRRWRRCASS